MIHISLMQRLVDTQRRAELARRPPLRERSSAAHGLVLTMFRTDNFHKRLQFVVFLNRHDVVLKEDNSSV